MCKVQTYLNPHFYSLYVWPTLTGQKDQQLSHPLLFHFPSPLSIYVSLQQPSPQHMTVEASIVRHKTPVRRDTWHCDGTQGQADRGRDGGGHVCLQAVWDWAQRGLYKCQGYSSKIIESFISHSLIDPSSSSAAKIAWSWSSCNKGCLLSKVIFHWGSSSMECFFHWILFSL